MFMKQLLFFGFLSGMLTISACHSGDSSTGVKAIIGDDNRQSEDRSFYRETIGRIKVGETTCNAFATGQNEITTAAHCVATDKLPEITSISFKTAGGENYEISSINLFDAKKDLARLTTKTPFKRWLERKPLEGGNLILTAVDTDTGLLLSDRNCVYEKERPEAGVFLHSCDTVPGTSGAPVIQDEKYVGVHIGYKKSVDRNIAFDISKDQDETVDILSLDFQKEGCHSRIHVRGGHSRAHVRDCTPEIPKPDFSWAIKAVAKPIADNISSRASNDGWTKESCEKLAEDVIKAVAVGFGPAICTAANFAAPACVAFLAASGAAIKFATCKQLCVDKHLADCR